MDRREENDIRTGLRGHTCCFTGHRAIPDAEREPLAALLRAEIDRLTKLDVTVFCCGGALGFDTMAATAVLEKKKRDPRVRLLLFLPCPGQDEGWPDADRVRYREILEAADAVSYSADGYTLQCMLARDRALADASSLCVSYLKHPAGGTFYTVTYARREGLQIINLAKKLV